MSYSAALRVLTTTAAGEAAAGGGDRQADDPGGVHGATRSPASRTRRAWSGATTWRRAARGASTRAPTARRGICATSRASCSPRPTRSRPGESAATLVGQQLLAFQQNFDGLDFAHAKAAGTDAVRRPDHRVDGPGRGARRPTREGRGGHLQPAARRDAAPGSTRPRATPARLHAAADRRRSWRSTSPYNTTPPRRPAADADRQPGLAAMNAAAHPAHVSLPVLRGQAVRVRRGSRSRRTTPQFLADGRRTQGRRAAARRGRRAAPDR